MACPRGLVRKTSGIVEASPIKPHNRIRPESDGLGLPSREGLIVTLNLFEAFKLGRNHFGLLVDLLKTSL